MSVMRLHLERLQLECELRRAEAELRLVREGELRAAEDERHALREPLPPPVRVRFVLHPDPETAAFQAAASRIERWWKTRRRELFPSNSEIARLVRMIRRGNKA